MSGDVITQAGLRPEEVADAALVIKLDEEVAVSEDEGARHSQL